MLEQTTTLATFTSTLRKSNIAMQNWSLIDDLYIPIFTYKNMCFPYQLQLLNMDDLLTNNGWYSYSFNYIYLLTYSKLLTYQYLPMK